MARLFVIVYALAVLIHCVYASSLSERTEDEQRLEAGGESLRKVGDLETKLRDDVIKELRDMQELEAALRRDLGLVHEKKRQLEIKRSGPIRCLINSGACL